MNGSNYSKSVLTIGLLMTLILVDRAVRGQYYGRYLPCPKSYMDPDGDCLAGLGGKDYPMLSFVPKTSFDCRQHPVKYVGYFADVETKCQTFHVCLPDARRDSFLCPNGTLFNQQFLVCDWWFNVKCHEAPMLYTINEYLQEPVNFRLGPNSPKVVPIPAANSPQAASIGPEPLSSGTMAAASSKRRKDQSFLSSLLFGSAGPSTSSASHGTADSVPLHTSNNVQQAPSSSSSSWSVPVSASMSYQNPEYSSSNKQADVFGSMMNAASLFSNIMSLVKTPTKTKISGPAASGPLDWLSSVIQPRSKSEPPSSSSSSSTVEPEKFQKYSRPNSKQKETADIKQPPIIAKKQSVAGSPR